MFFRSAIQVGPEQIARLDERQLRDLMEQLLLAETYRSNGSASQVVVNAEIHAADEGQDAWTPCALRPNSWLGAVETCWQFKSGREAKVGGEISTHTRVQDVLRGGGRYVVVASALGNGDAGVERRLEILRQEARALNLPMDKIEVLSCDRLVTWCNEHPAIAARMIRLPADWLAIDEWLLSRPHNQEHLPFVAPEEMQRLIIEVRIAIDPIEGEARHVHVWGPPGVGKTRFALEVCRGAAWRPETIYVYQSVNREVVRILSDLARDQHVRAVVVADDVAEKDIAELNDVVHRADGRLRLISIGQDCPRGDLALLARELAPLDASTLTTIIGRIHPGMPRDHQDYVAQLADGYIGLAIQIGRLVATDSQVRTRALLQHPDLRTVLGKLLPLEERPALYVLAALDHVGWEDGVADEGRSIAEHLGFSWSDVQCGVQAHIHDIVQKRGRYRYLSPRPLALYLAADLWDAFPDQMKTLPEVLPRTEAQDAFYRRLRALASCGNAAEFARREARLFSRLEHFTDPLAVRRWRAVNIAIPYDAIRTLREVLTSASHEVRTTIPSNARWELVSELSRAASFHCVLSAAVRDSEGAAALGSGPSTAISWRKPVHGTTRAIGEVRSGFGWGSGTDRALAQDAA